MPPNLKKMDTVGYQGAGKLKYKWKDCTVEYILHVKSKENISIWSRRADSGMQLHTGAEHFGNVIKRGIAKRGCS
jgi:hypothetical protein